MKFTTIAAALAMAQSAVAWQITVYAGQNCDNPGSDDYYILEGSGNDCYVLGTAPPSGIQCSRYTDGGRNGPIGCEGGFTGGGSYVVSSGPTGYVYYGNACAGNGDYWRPATECTNVGVGAISGP